MTPQELVGHALAVSEEGLRAGELPVGAVVVMGWRPADDDMPFYRMPFVSGGIREAECRAQFRTYCDTAPESGMRRWAETMIS